MDQNLILQVLNCNKFPTNKKFLILLFVIGRLDVLMLQKLNRSSRLYIYIYIYIYTEWPKKCIHSLLINIFEINLNEISISG